MDDALEGEYLVARRASRMSGDSEVNERLSQLSARLAGEPSIDEVNDPHVTDEQVDSAMDEVVAHIVDPGHIRDAEVDEAMLGVLDRVVAPVVIPSEYLDPADRTRAGTPPPPHETDAPERLDRQQTPDELVRDALIDRLGTDPRKPMPLTEPTFGTQPPMPRRLPPSRARSGEGLPNEVLPHEVLPNEVAALAGTPVSDPLPVEPRESVASSPPHPAGPDVGPPVFADSSATAAVDSVPDDVLAEDLLPNVPADDLLPEDGQLFQPNIFPARPTQEPMRLGDGADLFRSRQMAARETVADGASGAQNGSFPTSDRRFVGADAWQALAKTGVNSPSVDVDVDVEVDVEVDADVDDDDETADAAADNDDETADEVVGEVEGAGEQSAGALGRARVVPSNLLSGGDRDRTPDVAAPTQPAPVDPEQNEGAVSWPFDERPSRWPRVVLIATLAVLCVVFGALVVFAALSRRTSAMAMAELISLAI